MAEETKKDDTEDGSSDIDQPESSEVRALRINSEKLDVPADKVSSKPASPSSSHENCCSKCCSSFMKVVAKDALYGSFVGPHPVSFLCFCSMCKGCCCENCVKPFCVSSIATKVMYFIMLGIVSLLACFFIIPWPNTLLSHSSTAIDSFYPCQSKSIRNEHLNKGCAYNAGYFMVYRCFFAFGTLMLTNSLIMINVKSTKKSPHRAKIHRAFWFYKYLYLAGLLVMYFLMLDGYDDKEGVFEYICSIIGNIVHIFFTLVELTFILDLVELWVVENRTSGSGWSDCLYWAYVGIIAILDLIVFCYIFKDFSMERKFEPPKYPDINCAEGEVVQIDFLHILLIGATLGLIVLLMFVMCSKRHFKERFPYTGWMQVVVIILFNLLYLWSALYSSTHIGSRPRCNWAEHTMGASNLQSGSKGVYFRVTGLFHAILAILTLLYFTFVHGPRAETAPFSVAYYLLISDKARIPVFPNSDDSPQEYLDAIKNYKVWDDEYEGVAFSWSLFYVMMTMGGLSIMMSMTNFIDPWADNIYNSSMISLGCKLGSAMFATFLYMLLLLVPNSKITPESELMKKRATRIKKKLVDIEAAVEEKIGEIIGAVSDTAEALDEKLTAALHEAADDIPAEK